MELTHWARHEVKTLIEMYENEKNLWDVENPNYNKKDYRKRSIEKIRDKLENKFTVTEINDKLKHLRSYYAKELHKVRNSERNGGIYTSKWYHFRVLDVFLRRQIVPRIATRSSDSVRVKREPLSDGGIEGAGNQHTLSQSQKPKRQKTTTEQPVVVQETLNSSPQLKNKASQHTKDKCDGTKEDEDLTFARYLTNELNKIYDPFVKNNLKLKLQSLIFDAQREQASSTHTGATMSTPNTVCL